MKRSHLQKPIWLLSPIKIVLFVLILQSATATTPFEDYERCRDDESFGKKTLICDPEHTLKNSTIEKLDALLTNLQENAKRPARCSNPSSNSTDAPKKYVGLLQVSSSQQVSESGAALKENAKRIYDTIPLGNNECDNGVLIFYLKDKQQLATYNGNDHFVQLTNADIDKLHKLSGKDEDGGALALQFLRDQSNNSEDKDIQRAESWAPVVGLTAALVLILLVLALCLAIFIARFCCCGSKTKKNKYYVTPVPTYKTVDPIYIVTPPISERHGPHSDIIYSTPYSGTPQPTGPVYATAPYYSGSHVQTPRSNYGRSITPTSTNRVRLDPQAHAYVKSTETPKSNKKDKINRSGTAASKHSNATYHTVNNSSAATLPAVEGISPGGDRSGSSAGDFTFLDPKRKLETQTREDFIA